MGGAVGMGGGMRSVPPTGAPFAVLGPNQTRTLSTRLVSLNPPTADGTVAMPASGEKLSLGDIGQLNADPKTAAVVRRLAEAKAPSTTSQLVLWNVSAGLDWDTIAGLSKGWADPRDVDLARQFVANFDASAKEDAGRLYVEVVGDGPTAGELKGLFKGATVLGLKVEAGVPANPEGPSMALTVGLPAGASGKAEVAVKSSDGRGRWVDAGKLTVPMTKKDGQVDVRRPGRRRRRRRPRPHRRGPTRQGQEGQGQGHVLRSRSSTAHHSFLNGVAFDAAAAAPRAVEEPPGLVWGLCVSPGKVHSRSARHRRKGQSRAARPDQGRPRPRRRPQRPLSRRRPVEDLGRGSSPSPSRGEGDQKGGRPKRGRSSFRAEGPALVPRRWVRRGVLFGVNGGQVDPETVLAAE